MSEPNFFLSTEGRNRRGRRWKSAFLGATALSVLFLSVLVFSVVNRAFGYVVLEFEVSPESLQRGNVPLESEDRPFLVELIRENVGGRFFSAADSEKPFADRDRAELLDFIRREVVIPSVARSWSLSESLFSPAAIRKSAKELYPGATLEFRSWVNPHFIVSAQSSSALDSGIRSAAMGSFATILLTILFSLPLGVGAAVWLQEYARDSRLNRIIQTNIYNLAGVPSIIYGILGLAIFVRSMAPLTSGAFTGLTATEGQDGRTVLSAGLTLAVLILPTIIISTEEALKAVPSSLRQSSLALGATKWQTILHHVLPASIDRIMTGVILGVSRALGETAPLVVVGASTFLTHDPTGIFSRFTTLPIQIYQWTARPQQEFRNLAAGAILVLLTLLLILNAAAILIRTGYRKNKRLGL